MDNNNNNNDDAELNCSCHHDDSVRSTLLFTEPTAKLFHPNLRHRSIILKHRKQTVPKKSELIVIDGEEKETIQRIEKTEGNVSRLKRRRFELENNNHKNDVQEKEEWENFINDVFQKSTPQRIDNIKDSYNGSLIEETFQKPPLQFWQDPIELSCILKPKLASWLENSQPSTSSLQGVRNFDSDEKEELIIDLGQTQREIKEDIEHTEQQIQTDDFRYVPDSFDEVTNDQNSDSEINSSIERKEIKKPFRHYFLRNRNSYKFNTEQWNMSKSCKESIDDLNRNSDLKVSSNQVRNDNNDNLMLHQNRRRTHAGASRVLRDKRDPLNDASVLKKLREKGMFGSAGEATLEWMTSRPINENEISNYVKKIRDRLRFVDRRIVFLENERRALFAALWCVADEFPEYSKECSFNNLDDHLFNDFIEPFTMCNRSESPIDIQYDQYHHSSSLFRLDIRKEGIPQMKYDQPINQLTGLPSGIGLWRSAQCFNPVAATISPFALMRNTSNNDSKNRRQNDALHSPSFDHDVHSVTVTNEDLMLRDVDELSNENDESLIEDKSQIAMNFQSSVDSKTKPSLLLRLAAERGKEEQENTGRNLSISNDQSLLDDDMKGNEKTTRDDDDDDDDDDDENGEGKKKYKMRGNHLKKDERNKSNDRNKKEIRFDSRYWDKLSEDHLRKWIKFFGMKSSRNSMSKSTMLFELRRISDYLLDDALNCDQVSISDCND